MTSSDSDSDADSDSDPDRDAAGDDGPREPTPRRPRTRWGRRIAVAVPLVVLLALAIYGAIPGRMPAANPTLDPSRHEVVAVFGASGTVGDGVLKALLEEASVRTVHVVTRRTTERMDAGREQGKVEVHTHLDYLDYESLAGILPELDAVYWALGTSATNVDDAKYSEIHVDFPVAFVEAWLSRPGQSNRSFHLVTGQGTSDDGWQHWAREKARSERELFALAEGTDLRVVAYRPTYVAPSVEESGVLHSFVYRAFSPFDLATRSTDVGRAMLEVTARVGDELPHGTILENKDLLEYAAVYRERGGIAGRPASPEEPPPGPDAADSASPPSGSGASPSTPGTTPPDAAAKAEAELAKGAAPKGARFERMKASPQWAGSVFENPQPLWNSAQLTMQEMSQRPPHTQPQEPVPVESVTSARFETPPATGLRVTWLGHSTTLIEIDGLVVLTDPVWGDFAGPARGVGPDRFYAPPLPLDQLPEVDVILISHDHYDHLDTPTIVKLADRDLRFVAPLGVGAHLEFWGVPADHIEELDWWDATKLGDVEITCTPARHASGRGLFDQNRTLWAGYALRGPSHRVYFSGDTGLFPDMKAIGTRLGPFDLTMIEVGAYGRGWPDWHIGPEQAVKAHGWLRGEVLLPIHWGLFDLASHGWTEPIERVVVAAQGAGVTLVSPKPGGTFEPGAPPPLDRWWPELPWRTAEEAPIVSTKVD